MVDIIKWKESYTVDVDEIDYQHHYFAKLINLTFRVAN